MKKHFLFAAAAAALMTCACSVEPMDIVDVQPEEEITVLTAGFAGSDETRTVRQPDGKVFWSPGDALSVIRADDSADHRKFVTDITEPAPTADFKGVLPSGSGPMWAVYPYREDNRLENGYLMVTLPPVQEAVAGSFAKDAFFSAAIVTDTDSPLQFCHVFSGLKFTVLQPGIRRVTLIPESLNIVAGRFGLEDTSYSGISVTMNGPDEESFTTVELCAPEGKALEQGVPYHLVMRPVYLIGGFTLAFEKMDGSVAFRTIKKSKVFQKGHFVTMMEADRDLAFESFFEVSPSECSVGAEGGAFKVHVRSSEPYHVDTSNCDWIQEIKTVGTASMPDGADIYFAAQPNPGPERTGLISVCTDGADGTCHPVIVSQPGGEGLKRIVHHSLGLHFTATWCTWCPAMDELLHQVKPMLGDRIEFISLYEKNGDYGISTEETLADFYEVSGYPSVIIDGRNELYNVNQGAEVAAESIGNAIAEKESLYPSVTAIALSSTVSDRTVNVRADVFANVGERYRISAFLVESGIIGEQKSPSGMIPEYVHDRVARVQLTSSATGDSFTVSAGKTKTFNYTATVPSDCNLDNMEVIAYVERQYGDLGPVSSSFRNVQWYVDNCRNAALGTTVELEVE